MTNYSLFFDHISLRALFDFPCNPPKRRDGRADDVAVKRADHSMWNVIGWLYLEVIVMPNAE